MDARVCTGRQEPACPPARQLLSILLLIASRRGSETSAAVVDAIVKVDIVVESLFEVSDIAVSSRHTVQTSLAPVV